MARERRPCADDRAGCLRTRGQIGSGAIRREREGMGVDVVSFGCRLNAYEGEVIRRQAQAAGLVDAVIVNSCAVTAEAVRQSRQAIRRIKRERPAASIVATGCAAQTEPDTFAKMADVALVVGNEEKVSARTWRNYRDLLARSSAGVAAEEKVVVNDIMAVRGAAAALLAGLQRGAPALLPVASAAAHPLPSFLFPSAP